MPCGSDLTLTDGATLGLFYVQRYRFLTVDQFSRVSGLTRSTADDQLRMFERHGVVGFFGNTRLIGGGKSPKAYYLTRKGYDLLLCESDIPPEIVGRFKETRTDCRWSPQMFHRLRTVDVMIAAELAVRCRSRFSMVQTFLEYRRIKRGNHIMRETTDYVGEEEISENRIVPDAAFIIENIETKKRALFFVEMDMATERIISYITRDNRITLQHKLSQYDRYLKSLRYAQTYGAFGDFRHFTLLFVTIAQDRIDNIRSAVADLSPELHSYYRFSTFGEAMGDLFGAIWKSRALNDRKTYPLVQDEKSVKEESHATRHAPLPAQSALV